MVLQKPLQSTKGGSMAQPIPPQFSPPFPPRIPLFSTVVSEKNETLELSRLSLSSTLANLGGLRIKEI